MCQVMTTNESIGEIREEHNIEWRIEDFLTFLEKDVEFYTSPLFSFAGVSWYIKMVPNGSKDAAGYISLFIIRNSFGPPIKVRYYLSLKILKGEKDAEVHDTKIFEKEGRGYGAKKFLSRSKISENSFEFVPSDVLTICCILKYEKFTKGAETNEKLLVDLKGMMLNEDDSDTTIKVKGNDFLLHRNILKARNPFFRSMFECEMKEKSTGIVSIDDCEPDIFRSFIHFVYTGKTDKLSVENVSGLYKVADKYQENQLKAECLSFMIDEMTVDSFCCFIVLALSYDEKKLFQAATEFFCSKVREIIRNVKWHTFLREYPAEANELYIKALDHYDDEYDE